MPEQGRCPNSEVPVSRTGTIAQVSRPQWRPTRLSAADLRQHRCGENPTPPEHAPARHGAGGPSKAVVTPSAPRTTAAQERASPAFPRELMSENEHDVPLRPAPRRNSGRRPSATVRPRRTGGHREAAEAERSHRGRPPSPTATPSPTRPPVGASPAPAGRRPARIRTAMIADGDRYRSPAAPLEGIPSCTGRRGARPAAPGFTTGRRRSTPFVDPDGPWPRPGPPESRPVSRSEERSQGRRPESRHPHDHVAFPSGQGAPSLSRAAAV